METLPCSRRGKQDLGRAGLQDTHLLRIAFPLLRPSAPSSLWGDPAPCPDSTLQRPGAASSGPHALLSSLWCLPFVPPPFLFSLDSGEPYSVSLKNVTRLPCASQFPQAEVPLARAPPPATRAPRSSETLAGRGGRGSVVGGLCAGGGGFSAEPRGAPSGPWV